jgi:hypothetical protein
VQLLVELLPQHRHLGHAPPELADQERAADIARTLELAEHAQEAGGLVQGIGRLHDATSVSPAKWRGACKGGRWAGGRWEVLLVRIGGGWIERKVKATVYDF